MIKQGSVVVCCDRRFQFFGGPTSTDAADQVCGDVLVVDPPGGQMQNYIPGRAVAARRTTPTQIKKYNQIEPSLTIKTLSLCFIGRVALWHCHKKYHKGSSCAVKVLSL